MDPTLLVAGLLLLQSSRSRRLTVSDYLCSLRDLALASPAPAPGAVSTPDLQELAWADANGVLTLLVSLGCAKIMRVDDTDIIALYR